MVPGGVTQTLSRPWRDSAPVKAETSIQLNCSLSFTDCGTQGLQWIQMPKNIFDYFLESFGSDAEWCHLWLSGRCALIFVLSNKAHSCDPACLLIILWRRSLKISVDPWTGTATSVSQQQRMLENGPESTFMDQRAEVGCPLQLLLAEMNEESPWDHILWLFANLWGYFGPQGVQVFLKDNQ